MNRTMRRFLLMLLLLLLLGLVPLAASAGHGAADVESYTGCLTRGGAVVNVARGDQPMRPCNPDEAPVHLSGGDITSVEAGTGLVGGGTNGAVSLALDPARSLPQQCANGEVAKWDGSAWVCAEDDDTQYTAGTGLQLSGAGAFSVLPSYQLPQGCANGQAPLLASGNWTCGEVVEADQDCPASHYVRGVDGSGRLDCAVPPPSSTPLYTDGQALDVRRGLPANFQQQSIASVSLPAGTYFVMAEGVLLSDRNVDDFRDTGCSLRQGASTVLDRLTITTLTANAVLEVPFALSAAVSVPANTPMTLSCYAGTGANGMEIVNARLTALKVG